MRTPAEPRLVHCPICNDEFLWEPTDQVWIYDDTNAVYDPVVIGGLPPMKEASLRHEGYILCPNPSGDTHQHFLPATYHTYRDPIVIGLVGPAGAGKSHLLAAMMRETHLGALGRYRVRTKILDLRRHDAFRSGYLLPCQRGELLPATAPGIREPVEMLLLDNGTHRRPVTFFDVAGEDFSNVQAFNPSTQFLIGVDAVIFVHPLETASGPDTDWAFELATERIRGIPGAAARVPAAIAVTKADRLRHQPPIDHWLRAGEAPALDAALIREQSRDVYAYLHGAGAIGSLRPYDFFQRCTLHFVSALGRDPGLVAPSGTRAPRRTRAAQVLAPLVAILAMTGVITDPEALKVGLP